MIDRTQIQLELIKLATGERILRLSKPKFGLSLEKALDSSEAVVFQKERLMSVFEAALARAEVIAA